MTDLPPPPPPDEDGPDEPPSWPMAPPPAGATPPSPAPRPAAPGPPAQAQPPRARRGLLLGAAIFALIAMGAVVAAGAFVRSVTEDSTFTAHIDRANAYLDAVRSGSTTATSMLCPGAEVPVLGELTGTTSQYLSSFDVESTQGVVTGEVTFADGSSRPVTIVTVGPTFPGGDDPAAEVCIDAVILD